MADLYQNYNEAVPLFPLCEPLKLLQKDASSSIKPSLSEKQEVSEQREI